MVMLTRLAHLLADGRITDEQYDRAAMRGLYGRDWTLAERLLEESA